MLKASGIGCERDHQILFSDLTFEIEAGTLMLVTGQNGAGKSSLLKILAGLLTPETGFLLWEKQKLDPRDPFFLKKILYIGHNPGIQPILTPLQNLCWLLGILTNHCHKRVEVKAALQAVGLLGFEDIPCEYLSEGQRQRVALARLWLDPPSYWILDEPTHALDERGVDLLQQRFLMHLKKGGSIVVATHRTFAIEPFKKLEIHLGRNLVKSV